MINEETAGRWQASLNLLASATHADAAVMRRLAGRHIETFMCSEGEQSPYFPGEFIPTERGVLCKRVLTERIDVEVSDARSDVEFGRSPDVARGLTAYLGVPLTDTSGDVFASIALLSRSAAAFTAQDHELLRLVRLAMATDLSTLVESENSRPFREIAELSRDMISRHSADGAFLYASPASRSILGYEPDELVGRACTELVHPDDCQRVEEFLAQRGSGTIEIRVFRKDGGCTWIEAMIAPTSYDGGFHAVVRDVNDRKAAEQRLQASEELFRSAFERAITPFALLSPDGDILLANEAFATFTGFDLADLLSKNYADLRVPRDRDVVVERLAGLRDGGVQSLTSEREFIRKGGSRAWAMTGAAGVPDKDGGLGAITLQVIDTTERHESAARLAHSEARLRATVDNSPAGILLSDADGKCIEANPALSALLDRTADSLAGCMFKDFIHPDDVKDMARIHAGLKSGALTAGHTEARVLRGDGSLAWTLASSSAVHAQDGGVTYTVTHFVDITERKERELRLSLLERALNAAHGAVVICDARQKDFPIVAVNPAFEQITGYSAEEAVGRNARFLRSDKAEPESVDRLRDAIRQATDVTVKLTNRRKDGQPIWVELSISPVRGPDGKVAHFVGVMQDLTSRREADLAVKRAEERFAMATAAVEGTVYDWDRASNTVEWTEGLQRVFGFPADLAATTGDWYESQIHPDDRARAHDAVAAAIANGERIFSVEYRWQRHDGQYREVWDKGVIQRDDSGNAVRIVGTIGDVTDRALARCALAEAEAAERAALNDVPFYIDSVESPARTLYLSPSAAELFGVTREEWQADAVGFMDRVVVSEDFDALAASLRLEEAGDDHEAEYRVRHRDGAEIWLRDRVSIARDVNGRPLFAQGMLTDITERKRVELKAEAERLEQEAAAEAARQAEEAERRTVESASAPEAAAAKPIASPDDSDGDPPVQAVAATPETGSAPGEAEQQPADDFTLEGPLPDGDEHEPTPLVDGATRAVAESELLAQIESALASCQSTTDAFNAVSGLVNQLFPNLTGAIYATNSARSHAEAATVWNNSHEVAISFPVGDCWALKLGSTYQGNPMKGQACEHLKEPHPTAYMCVPLQSPDGPVGILYLAENREGALTSSAQQNAVRFAERFGMTLHGAAASDSGKTSATRDRATGLYNRQHAEELLTTELARIADGRGSLAVVMVDVDHLRRINTEFGHKAGDIVVKEVSGHLHRNVRKEEVAARFGDDEFMLVFLDTTSDDARQRAEGIREAVKLLDIKVSGKPIGKVTASFGIATCPDNGLARDVLIRAARAALLRAKRDGRDLVAAAYNPDRIGRTS